MKPPFNYFGAKSRAAGRIHELIPDKPDVWVDLFFGSGIVTLKKPRHSKEIVNDLNDDVINFFDVMQDDALTLQLLKLIELTPYSEELRNRVVNEKPDSNVCKAHFFLIRAWMGRAGRDNTGFKWSKEQTTAPEITWSKLPERLVKVAERMRGICIRKRNAIDLLPGLDDPNVIIFVDPPYPVAGQSYQITMSIDEHQALADALKATQAHVILTMEHGSLYDQKLKGWYSEELPIYTGGNSHKPETIFTNYDPLPLFNQEKLL